MPESVQMWMNKARRPRIKRTTEPFEEPGGDLRLMRPSSDLDVRIENPDSRDRRLLAALDGTHTLQELYSRFGAAEVDQAISELAEQGLIEDGADDDRVEPDELARFDRQLRYFSDVTTDGGPTPSECQRRLQMATVAILGVGGLGGWAAWALACTGIGALHLVDGDRVEVSNLNRQILYAEADIGEVKVDVAAEKLRAFNSKMSVIAHAKRLESEGDVAELVEGVDVVIAAADWPAHLIEQWCNAACFKAGVPYITMGHFPPIARVGPFYVPGRTGCFACQEIAYRREYPLLDLVMAQRRAREAPAATLGPPCGLIGGQVGMEVMHLITGLCEPSTLGQIHFYDLRTMEVRRELVVQEAACPVCAGKGGHQEQGGRCDTTAGP